MTKTACPACSCLCDDLDVEQIDSKVKVKTDCRLAQAWFAKAATTAMSTGSGTSEPLKAKIGSALNLIADAKVPLVTGLNHLPADAQFLAWKLADSIAAVIDIGFSNDLHAPTIAFQELGGVTATMGEIANRADVIVFWFCDPMTTHPRLIDRLKKNSQRIVVVDDRETQTAKQADRFWNLVKASGDSVLHCLQVMISGIDNDRSQESSPTNGAYHLDEVNQLAKLLSTASYGAFVSGPGSGADSLQLTRLVKKLNDKTRFVASRLNEPGNALSARNCLTALSGFPFAINHLQPVQEFNGDEYSTVNVLNRSEPDLLIYFGSVDELNEESKEYLSVQGREHLLAIPKIVVGPSFGDSKSNEPIGEILSIATGLPGWSSTGDLVRHDDVAIPMTKLVESDLPSFSEVIETLIGSPMHASKTR